MDGEMIDDPTHPPLDGSQFHDGSRFRSSELTRVFISAIRAASYGPQSEVFGPEEVSLERDAESLDAEIVRGVD
jgi:hypothetical protein